MYQDMVIHSLFLARQSNSRFLWSANVCRHRYTASVDYQASCGICGNFNGDRNDDAPAYRVNNYNELWGCQQVPSVADHQFPNLRTQVDIWNWVYNEADFNGGSQDVSYPGAQETCPYELLEIIMPIIAGSDVEVITEQLETLAEGIQNQDGGALIFDPTTNETTQVTPYDRDLATLACQAVLDASSIVTVCDVYPEFNEAEFVEDCTIDYSETGGPGFPLAQKFLDSTLQAAEAACLGLAVENGDLDNATITAVLCQDACNGRGNCTASATCICEAGYIGSFCEIDSNSPPQVQQVSALSYDSSGLQVNNTPSNILIYGTNILEGSENLVCKFGTNVTRAYALGPAQLICAVPVVRHTGPSPLYVPLQVSNDGIIFSPPTLQFMYYDGKCQVCSANKTCGTNPSTCTINGACYLPNAFQPATETEPSNPCKQCVPTVSNTEFTYVYGSGQCKPTFTQVVYEHTIISNASAAAPLVFVNAEANILVNADPDYDVTYSLVPNIDPSVATSFQIDAQTGGVSLIANVDITSAEFQNMEHAADNPTVFNGALQVIATDQTGLTTTAAVLIDLVPADYSPVFPAGGFHGSIPENSPEGALVMNANGTAPLRIQAADEELFTNTGIAYKFFYVPTGYDNVFVLNETTGLIMVGPAASALDHEVVSDLLLQVDVTDNTGIFHVTELVIDVTDVPEAPTSITVTPNRVAEGTAARMVGVLSATDPEGGMLTFTTSTAGFIVNVTGDVSQLVMTKAVSYEDAADRVQTVSVTVTDSTMLNFTTDLTIDVTNVNDAPTDIAVENVEGSVFRMTSPTTATVPEDATVGTLLAIATAVDPEGDAVTCMVADPFFQVVDNSQLQLKQPLNFEFMSTVTLQIACMDTYGLYTETPLAVVVTVQDVDELPVLISFEPTSNVIVESDNVATTLIGVITVADHDAGSTGPIPISLPTGYSTSNQTCTTLPNDGVQCTADVFILQNSSVNFESTNNGTQYVTTNLGLDAGNGQSEVQIGYTVGNAPDAPTSVSISSTTVEEQAPAGTTVANLTIEDEDEEPGSFTATFVSNPNDAFALVPKSNASNVTRARREDAGNVGGKDWELVVNNASALNYRALKDGINITLKIVDNLIANASKNTLEWSTNIEVTDRPLVLVTNASIMSKAAHYSGLSFSLLNQDDPEMNDKVTYAVQSVNPPAVAAHLKMHTDGDTGLLAVESDIEANSASIVIQIGYTFVDDGYAPGVRAFTIRLEDPPFGPTMAFVSAGSAVTSTVMNTNVYVANPSLAMTQDVAVVRVHNDAAPGQTAITSFDAPTAWTGGKPETCSFVNLMLPQPFGPNANRFVTDCDYIYNNYESLNTSALLEAQQNFKFTSATGVDNDMDTTIRFSGTALTVPRVETVFIRAKDVASDMGLAAFLTMQVSFSDPCGVDVNGDAQYDSPCGSGQICTASTVGYTCADTTTTVTTTTTQTTATEMSDENDEPVLIISSGSTGADANDSSASVGLIVGVFLVLLCFALVIGAVYLRRQKEQGLLFDSDVERSRAPTFANPTYASTDDYRASQASTTYEELSTFTPGVNNPMYDWYQPAMTRKDATEYLSAQGEGAFIVRDSDANPGWFMLGVKSHNVVVHDKIRMTQDGRYELLPSMGQAAEKVQPSFSGLPELVEYYTEVHNDMAYTLYSSNPIYDNHQLIQERTGSVVYRSSNNVPALPQKDNRQYDEVPTAQENPTYADAVNFGGDALSNPMYGKELPATPVDDSSEYLDVSALEDVEGESL